MSKLLDWVNANSNYSGVLELRGEFGDMPVLATPAVAAGAAKAAGFVVGGGAVTGGAVAAYNAAAG